jgi:ornithine carbamoyltransferase
MTDILTIIEHRGSIEKQVIAWIGDGNNMTTSWIHAATKFGFTLKIATPQELEPNTEVIEWAKNNGANITLSNDAKEAAQSADVINADCWVSMGDKDADVRMEWLQPFQIDSTLMSYAKADAVFMHCLPAHRGEEVTESVIDGKQSIIFDEAENRLHMQKAIMAWCQGIKEI